jgi:hypothetical protein
MSHTGIRKAERLEHDLRFLEKLRCNALDPKACASALASRPALQSRIWACDGSRHTPKG